MKFSIENSSFILKFENVQLVDRYSPQIKTNGALFLTDSHLAFIDAEKKCELWIYYSLIASVEKQPLNITGSPILIRCKHFLNCLFVISKERDCQTLNATLLQCSRPTKMQELLCFKENKHLQFLRATRLSNNKKIFDLESEYMRMGVPNAEWSTTDINFTYEACDTYPNALFVPSSASSAVLRASANFRSRGRLPVLSYLHSNGASICRCAQPLSGFNARCVEDEQYLQLIRQTNEKSKFMYIVDTRPKINAMANKAQGKGYENENHYTNIQFYFIGIENIHVMRSSLQKLLESCDIANTNTVQFYSALEKCEWLKHIKAIIDTSVFITEAVNDQNASVVVHCSDGWDRTAQTCALASLLLDPYYRTVHGFQVLIEKEWLTFGHKFSHRSGHVYEGESASKEASPVFQQFLECVWQLTQQFPTAFEFNERFLIKLHEHVYSCQFGTFVANCQKERVELKISDTTYSLWDYVQYKINDYVNPLYIPNSVYSRQVLKPDTRSPNLKFWRGLYNRFDANVNPNENLIDSLSMVVNSTSNLIDNAKLLEKCIAQLKALIDRERSTELLIDLSESEQPTAAVETQMGALDLERSRDQADGKIPGQSPPSPPPQQLQQQQQSPESVRELETTMTPVSATATRFCISQVAAGQLGLNWKSTRHKCTCSSRSYDYAGAHINCAKCGEIKCESCVEMGKYSSSLVSTKLVFTCMQCA